MPFNRQDLGGNERAIEKAAIYQELETFSLE